MAGIERQATAICLDHLKMQAANEHAYLTLRPDSPPQICDILLRLDDGTRLPVQSRVLAQYSPVFRICLTLGPSQLPRQLQEKSCRFFDCPREVATGCLSMLYSAL